METPGLFVYIIIVMANFMRLMNTTWEMQTLDLFAKEFREYAQKELPILYPLFKEESPEPKTKLDITYRFGTFLDSHIHARMTPMKETLPESWIMTLSD